MMHMPADDPLLFCEAPNAIPWSHLFDLDSRRPTCYTVKKSVFYCIWILDYGRAVELD